MTTATRTPAEEVLMELDPALYQDAVTGAYRTAMRLRQEGEPCETVFAMIKHTVIGYGLTANLAQDIASRVTYMTRPKAPAPSGLVFDENTRSWYRPGTQLDRKEASNYGAA